MNPYVKDWLDDLKPLGNRLAKAFLEIAPYLILYSDAFMSLAMMVKRKTIIMCKKV
jgi:hypothetical protein